MNYNIMVAGFHHETNTFSPEPTGYNEFLKADGWPGLTRHDDILQVLPPLNLPLGGFLNAAGEHKIIPTCWANAEPYGPVTRDAFERITSMILDDASSTKKIDAVYLDLHGAMVVEHLDDGEGALLSLLRDKLGDNVPIVCSLDFHANVTPDMFELSDALTIFRSYPHIDMADTGRRAFLALKQMLEAEEKFAKAYRQVPYLISLPDQYTGASPCKEWYEHLENTDPSTIVTSDIACGFPAADIKHCGASAVTYGKLAKDVVKEADDCLAMITQSESRFTDQLLAGKEAIQQAIAMGKPGAPCIVADVQDNPGAGGSADTTGVLHALVESGAQNAIVGSLWDSAAAAAAHAAGIGATITLDLGGKCGPDEVKPFSGEFIVETLSDGVFTCHGAMLGGIQLNLGLMALLRVKDSNSSVRIAVASERFQCLDQGLFRELGVEPKTQAIVVVKSTVHFRADFDAIAADTVLAEFPGAHPCRLETIPYQHLRPGLRLGPNSSRTSV